MPRRTSAAREAERRARLDRGKPYAEFVAEWETDLPPADVPFYGSWNDRRVLHRGTQEDTCPADAIVPVMMPDPKDVRIAALEAELAELQAWVRLARTRRREHHERAGRLGAGQRERLTWLDCDRYVWAVFAGGSEHWHDDPGSMIAAAAQAQKLCAPMCSASICGSVRPSSRGRCDASSICAVSRAGAEV